MANKLMECGVKGLSIAALLFAMAGVSAAGADKPQTLQEKIAAANWAAVRGANFIPSYASNTYDIWHNYDHDVFDRELRLVSAVGYNSIRLWLNYAAFEQSGPRMVEHVEDALRLCGAHHLRAVVNLFDSCGLRPRKDARWMTARDAYDLFQNSSRFTAEQKAMMRQLFDRYAHGFGAQTLVTVAADTPMMALLWQNWQSTPGNDHLTPGSYAKLERYVDAIVGRMKDNPSILLWDVMNEPEFASEGPLGPGVLITPEMEQIRDTFLKHFHEFLRRRYPNEILSVGWAQLQNAEKYADLADVLTFHVYGEPARLQSVINEAVSVSKRCNKQILITETLANWDFGSPEFGRLASDEQQLAHYQNDLPVLMKSPIGWIAWGMIVNRTFDPFTDIFYPDGHPRPAAIYLQEMLRGGAH